MSTQTPSQRITEVVGSWRGIEAGPGRRGEFAFRLGRREIGHLHGDHAAHFSFPKELWAELKDAGRIVEHPVFPGRVGPAARRIEGEGDVDEVIALMRLNYERANGSPRTLGKLGDAELAYLTAERRLARLATVGADGTPHVVPVGFAYEPDSGTIDVGGHDLANSRKYKDVARTGRAAIVIDDLASADPWRPRGVEIRGRAEVITQPRPLIRIYPDRVRSWGVEPGGANADGARAA
jgi:pyridoxamine 5'-phosphate oxidase family protein